MKDGSTKDKKDTLIDNFDTIAKRARNSINRGN